MNFNYCVLSILLASSITHAMESDSKPSQGSQPKVMEGKSLPLTLQSKNKIGAHKHISPKKNIPFAIPISLRKEIPFGGKRKSIFQLLSKPQKPFGKTPILSVAPDGIVTNLGLVNRIDDPKPIVDKIVLQQALYIANTHSHRLSENSKRISYGTLVVSSAIDPKKQQSIETACSVALGYILTEKMKTQRLSPRKKTDSQSKAKQEEETHA